MATDRERRIAIAADLLRCEGSTPADKAKEAERLVANMPRAERVDLTRRINGVIEWVAEYEAIESQLKAQGAL